MKRRAPLHFADFTLSTYPTQSVHVSATAEYRRVPPEDSKLRQSDWRSLTIFDGARGQIFGNLAAFITNHSPLDFHFSWHEIFYYNRICLILKKLNRHKQYGHHFEALGMYLKTMRTLWTKWTSKWSFFQKCTPLQGMTINCWFCIYRYLRQAARSFIPLLAPWWATGHCWR